MRVFVNLRVELWPTVGVEIPDKQEELYEGEDCYFRHEIPNRLVKKYLKARNEFFSASAVIEKYFQEHYGE